MKRQRKNFLGIIGLALVTAMTVYASSLPPQKADATSSGSTTISVTVLKSNPTTKIIYPGNEDRVSNNILDIKVTLIKDKASKVFLTNVRTGAQYIFDIPAQSEDDVTKILSVDLDQYGGAGDYKILVQSLNEDESIYSEDNASFVYKKLPAPKPTPDVPNTGSFLQELNLSRSDYIITGIIAFILITVAVVILKKKSSRR